MNSILRDEKTLISFPIKSHFPKCLEHFIKNTARSKISLPYGNIVDHFHAMRIYSKPRITNFVLFLT